MFKQRVITAAILLPLALLLVFATGFTTFALVLGAVYCLAASEYLALASLGSRVFYVLILLAFPCLMLLVAKSHPGFLIPSSSVIYILMSYFIWVFPKHDRYWFNPIAVVTLLFFSLLGSYQSLLIIKANPSGHRQLLCLLLMIWAADSGAYFVGKLWGCRRLIPQVSPGKSVEGFWGGYISVLLVALGAWWVADRGSLGFWYCVATAIFLAAVVGDLLISMLKRKAKVKDTGRLLPGHGGVMDRIDSLVCASTVFVMVSRLIQ